MSTDANRTEDQCARRVVRNDRTPLAKPPAVGAVVHLVGDEFSLAHEDSRRTGIEHVAVSPDLSKDFYFTIPLEDLEKLT